MEIKGEVLRIKIIQSDIAAILLMVDGQIVPVLSLSGNMPEVSDMVNVKGKFRTRGGFTEFCSGDLEIL